MKKRLRKDSKWFFLGLLIFIAILSFFIIKPFGTAIISGAILAYVFYPLYRFLQKKIKSKTATALIVSVVMILVITIPPFFILNHVTQEAYSVYYSAREQLEGAPGYGETKANILMDFDELLKNEKAKEYMIKTLKDVVVYLTTKVSNIILSLPQILLKIIVAIFTSYYLLKNGKELMQRIIKATPLTIKHRQQIVKKFGAVVYAVIFGTLIVALIQGLLGTIGFFIFGVNGAVSWGMVMAFFALIPFIGTWIIWMPAGIVMIANGYLNSTPSLIWKGVGLLIYGLVIISSIDNILKPLLVAGKGKIHPILALLGVIGGLFVFGLIGVIIGPIILGLLQTLVEIFEKDKLFRRS